MTILASFAALALLAASPQQAEVLTNETVVALAEAGLGDEAIVAKIRSSPVRFDVSTSTMLELRKRGVTSQVIAAMVEASTPRATAISSDSPDPMVPHSAGVYLLSDEGSVAKMLRMDATASSQVKTGGIFGYALTSGIASMSIKAAIANETARVGTGQKQPKFFFFFDESNPATGSVQGTWLSGTAATVTSPNEFVLVRLTKKSGRREARVGSMNIGGTKVGVMDKDRIAFDYEVVRPGVYQVMPRVPLSAGEYGYIHSISGGGAGAVTARIFDFTVR